VQLGGLDAQVGLLGNCLLICGGPAGAKLASANTFAARIRHARPLAVLDPESAFRAGGNLLRGRHLPHDGSQPPLRFRRQQGQLFASPPRSADIESGTRESAPGEVGVSRFSPVYLEPHTPLKEMTDRSHDTLSGPCAAHEDVAIVGVTNEPMTPPLQFPVRPRSSEVGGWVVPISAQ
jgi:hypothetical protein